MPSTIRSSTPCPPSLATRSTCVGSARQSGPSDRLLLRASACRAKPAPYWGCCSTRSGGRCSLANGTSTIAAPTPSRPTGNRLAGARSISDTNRALTKSRQSSAWEGLGHAIGAYECAVAYAQRREQFGRPIAAFQLVQDKLSNMLSDITGMQLTCFRMAQLQQQGTLRLEHAALAKLQTASAARRVCAMARDILGGNGILLDHHVARHHADMEAVYTYEGTDTVQALIVGRAITGHSAFA